MPYPEDEVGQIDEEEPRLYVTDACIDAETSVFLFLPPPDWSAWESPLLKFSVRKGTLIFAVFRNTSKAMTLIYVRDVEILELDAIESHDASSKTGRISLGMLTNSTGRDFNIPLFNGDIDEAKEFFDVKF
ncbi:hypothetical protein GGR58DRAFT_500908 [Xylaria digitata]|nr:hypothetical protein GGR58DRAFT_500908 [Xylaria digitata]